MYIYPSSLSSLYPSLTDTTSLSSYMYPSISPIYIYSISIYLSLALSISLSLSLYISLYLSLSLSLSLSPSLSLPRLSHIDYAGLVICLLSLSIQVRVVARTLFSRFSITPLTFSPTRPRTELMHICRGGREMERGGGRERA